MVSDSILAILGPTASGKTGLAVMVAKYLGGEIVGLDSRQIYQMMSIGTAQPASDEQDGIPHHLIGFLSPEKTISAGAYAKLVFQSVAKIRERGNVPIICGGAGLYYRAVTKGIFKGSVTDLDARKKLNDQYDKDGGQALLDRLSKIDPDYASITHQNNRKRLVRALEIYHATGKTPTQHFLDQKKSDEKGLDPVSILLLPEMNYLEERIRQRTIEMLERGWVDEVKKLKSHFPSAPLPPLDSIGYREIQKYIADDQSMDSLIDEIVLRTRQFAKRQIQWFRHETVDATLPITASTTSEDLVSQVLQIYYRQVPSK